METPEPNWRPAGRPAAFYEDFEVFVREVGVERARRGKLAAAWVASTAGVLGAASTERLVKALGSAGVAQAVAGVVGVALGMPLLAALAVGAGSALALRSASRELAKAAQGKEVDAETRRLVRARAVFEDLARERRRGTGATLDGDFQQLFDDLVEGRDIIV